MPIILTMTVLSNGQSFEITADMKDYIKAHSNTEVANHSGPCNSKVLKCIRCLIGSQCSVDRTVLMWSYFLVLVRTLAAAF